MGQGPRSRDPELMKYLLLLRYGTSDDPDPRKPVLNLRTVARIAKVPVATVSDNIRVGLRLSQ